MGWKGLFGDCWTLGHLSLFSSFFPLPAPKETQGKDEGNQGWWVNGSKAEDLWCWRDLEGKGDAGKWLLLGKMPPGNHIPLEIRSEAHEDSEHGDPAMALIFLQLFLQMVPMRPGATGRSLFQPSPHPRLLCLQEPGKPEPRANTTCHRHLQPL